MTDEALVKTLDEVERGHILWALNEFGDKTKVAKLLGIDRRTLYRKLRRYGIHIAPVCVKCREAVAS